LGLPFVRGKEAMVKSQKIEASSQVKNKGMRHEKVVRRFDSSRTGRLFS
jgi:hypothetical protein